MLPYHRRQLPAPWRRTYRGFGKFSSTVSVTQNRAQMTFKRLHGYALDILGAFAEELLRRSRDWKCRRP